MQIVTINVPDMFLDAIQDMVHAGQYPSRSEAIRCALRSFLGRELELVNALMSISTHVHEEHAKAPTAVNAAKRIDMRSIRKGWAS